MKLLIFLCTALIATAEDDAKDTIRRYDGTIGKDMAVSLILNASDNNEGGESYSGSYLYKKTGVPISLSQQEDKKTVAFHENEHWDSEKYIFTGQWRVKIEGGTVTGTWSSPDGKKSLPISLKESYPAGSFRCDVVQFQNSWIRKRDRKELGAEKSVGFLQFKGEAPGLPAVNEALRKIAWTNASDRDGQGKPKAPAEASIAAIEKAVSVKPPTELNWDDAYIERRSSSMDLIMNDSGMICVSILNSYYIGGAHDNYGISHATFDTETGRQLKLADLVNPGFEKRWAALGAAEIRAAYGQKPNSPLTDSGLFEDKLELNENWFLTPGGIGFCYDPYEIASFAQGTVEFTLPWKRIAQDLKHGTRVEELAKRVLEKAK